MISSSTNLFLGERTHVDLGVSTEVSVPSHPVLPPEASSHSASVLGVSPRPQDQTSPMDLGPERTEGKVYNKQVIPMNSNITPRPNGGCIRGSASSSCTICLSIVCL